MEDQLGPGAHLELDAGAQAARAAARAAVFADGAGRSSGGAAPAGAGGRGAGAEPMVDPLAFEVPEGQALATDVRFEIGGAAARLVATRDDAAGAVHVRVLGEKLPPLAMHWGARRGGEKWAKPGDELLGPASARKDRAVQTDFAPADGGQAALVRTGGDAGPDGIDFVLRHATDNEWYKAGGGDFFVRLREDADPDDTPFEQLDLGADAGALGVDRMVAFEARGGLSLMERFAAARGALRECAGDRARLRAVFVWLRFSQMRQLAWQRRHNTKPTLLSQEADKLSMHITAQWAAARGVDAELLRLMLSAVPRGSGGDDGQAIRDQILVIMRQFEIKKRKGCWMEEWHQKLHNNSTPDDIIICEAYIKFLESEGNLDVFYAHLHAHGLNRQRMQQFERPILQEPVYFPSIRTGARAPPRPSSPPPPASHRPARRPPAFRAPSAVRRAQGSSTHSPTTSGSSRRCTRAQTWGAPRSSRGTSSTARCPPAPP